MGRSNKTSTAKDVIPTVALLPLPQALCGGTCRGTKAITAPPRPAQP